MSESNQPRLYYFFGRECTWCEKMHPLVDLLEHKENVKLVQLEVWHDADNQEKMKAFAETIRPACGGRLAVPAFYNTKTNKALCGCVQYDALKTWATE